MEERSTCNKEWHARKPYPAMRIGFTMQLQPRRRRRSRHTTSYQQLQRGELPEGRLHNGSQSFLSFCEVGFLGLRSFIKNKKALGRLQDLAHLELLKEQGINVD